VRSGRRVVVPREMSSRKARLKQTARREWGLSLLTRVGLSRLRCAVRNCGVTQLIKPRGVLDEERATNGVGKVASGKNLGGFLPSSRGGLPRRALKAVRGKSVTSYCQNPSAGPWGDLGSWTCLKRL